jgi:hypothetical protein
VYVGEKLTMLKQNFQSIGEVFQATATSFSTLTFVSGTGSSKCFTFHFFSLLS